LCGGDPWLPYFLDRYFFGVGDKVTLTKEQVRSLDVFPFIIDFHGEPEDFFQEARTISATQSQRIFEVASKGAGNMTLGKFNIVYTGVVANCKFKGQFKLSDRFNFDWQAWGIRSTGGELQLRLFTLMTSGLPFDVDSEWIDVQQMNTDPKALW
jgi:hypothetical protein